MSVWWKGGVEKNRVLFAHVPEPMCLNGGRAGWKRTGFFSHTYRSQNVCMTEGRGGKEQGSFRTRIGVNISAWWKGGVEENRVFFAHAPEIIYT
jgi:hypothetical protein